MRIERRLKEAGADDNERRAIRQTEAKPLLKSLEAWLELQTTKVLPRSPAAAAIGYALNQWNALERYADDGRLEIDNNAAERALRPIAVGRKNWLFFQNDSGGETAVILMSLYRTAVAIGINPQIYFRDLMLRIGSCSDAARLTPHGWSRHFLAEVDEKRREFIAAVAAQ